MSNVNSVLVALMTAGASGLAEAVKIGRKLEGEIFASAVTVSAVAAYRVGRAIVQGETAEEKERKYSNAFAEFQNHYVAQGNHVFRDSEGMQEFKNIKSALRKGETVGGPLVRAYVAACRTAKLSAKEHGIAEVQRFSKKIFDDSFANHSDTLREIANLEDLAAIVARWDRHVKENYGTTYMALKAYFSAGAKPGAQKDKVADATKLLLDLTDVAELTAIIQKLQKRADEMSAVSVSAVAAANPGRKTDEAAATAKPEAAKIAA